MCQRRNIARQSVLVEIAKELQNQTSGDFDARQFETDLDGAGALEAFRADLMLTRYRSIGRFPSLILRVPGQAPVIIVGFRPYDILVEVVTHFRRSTA